MHIFGHLVTLAFDYGISFFSKILHTAIVHDKYINCRMINNGILKQMLDMLFSITRLQDNTIAHTKSAITLNCHAFEPIWTSIHITLHHYTEWLYYSAFLTHSETLQYISGLCWGVMFIFHAVCLTFYYDCKHDSTKCHLTSEYQTVS